MTQETTALYSMTDLQESDVPEQVMLVREFYFTPIWRRSSAPERWLLLVHFPEDISLLIDIAEKKGRYCELVRDFRAHTLRSSLRLCTGYRFCPACARSLLQTDVARDACPVCFGVGVIPGVAPASEMTHPPVVPQLDDTTL